MVYAEDPYNQKREKSKRIKGTIVATIAQEYILMISRHCLYLSYPLTVNLLFRWDVSKESRHYNSHTL